jgi:hypothetical protein
MRDSEMSAWLKSHVPDTPDGGKVAEHLNELWVAFRSYADPNFVKEFCSGDSDKLRQRYWEMYLGVWLLERDFKLLPHRDAGPDIGVEILGRRIYFEAITPTAGSGDDRVPPLETQPWKPGESLAAKEVPASQIVLRWTAAFHEKARRFKEYLDAKIIQPVDACVIAINSCQTHFFGFDGISGYPAIMEAVYPIGPRQIQWVIDHPEQTSVNLTHRPSIQKSNQSLVETAPFLGDKFPYISAVLATHRNEWHKYSYPIHPIVLVHNVRAAIPIIQKQFPVDTEYRVEILDGAMKILVEPEPLDSE